MKVSISTTLKISAEDAWDLVKQSNTLHFVTRGLMGFKPIGPALPYQWIEDKTETLRIMLFGFIPAWKHQIRFKEISDSQMKMLTHESGGLINTWNHLISIKTIDDSSCKYTDEVEIKAGIFTPFIWAYANLFYRYRQKRWQHLINNI